MFVVLALALAAPEEPQALYYKFKPGDTAKYVYTVTVSQTQKTGASRTAEPKRSFELKFSIIWKVHKVSWLGVADVGQTMARVRVTTSIGYGKELVVDSAATDVPPAVKEYWEDFTKSEMTMKIAPNGEVTDVKLPDRMKERIRQMKEKGLTVLSEKIFTDQAKAVSFILPKKRVKVGESWLDGSAAKGGDEDVPYPVRFTYEGLIEEDGKKYHALARKLEVPDEESAETNGDRPFPIASGGRVLLDPTTGWLVEHTATGTLVAKSGKGRTRTETRTEASLEIHRQDPKPVKK
jgi:hypothetical protein